MEKFIYAVRDTETNKDIPFSNLCISNNDKKYYDNKILVERIVRENNSHLTSYRRYKLVTYKLVEVEN